MIKRQGGAAKLIFSCLLLTFVPSPPQTYSGNIPLNILKLSFLPSHPSYVSLPPLTPTLSHIMSSSFPQLFSISPLSQKPTLLSPHLECCGGCGWVPWALQVAWWPPGAAAVVVGRCDRAPGSFQSSLVIRSYGSYYLKVYFCRDARTRRA